MSAAADDGWARRILVIDDELTRGVKREASPFIPSTLWPGGRRRRGAVRAATPSGRSGRQEGI